MKIMDLALEIDGVDGPCQISSCLFPQMAVAVVIIVVVDFAVVLSMMVAAYSSQNPIVVCVAYWTNALATVPDSSIVCDTIYKRRPCVPS